MHAIRFLAVSALLTTYWPGHVSHDPATTMGACDAAGRAWMAGRGLPIGEHFPALSFNCTPMSPAAAGFKAGWDRIGGKR